MRQFRQSLPMMMHAALDAVMPRFRLIYKDFGLTEQQWRVLRVLWEHEQIGFTEMSEITLISAPSLIGVIDRIIAMGLVTKQRSQSDRRAVRISLTADGHKLQSQVMPRVEATYAQLEESIEPELWRQLLAGLEAVAALPPIETNSTQVKSA